MSKGDCAPESRPASRSRWLLWVAMGASVCFWASAYPAIRVGLRLFSPGQLASVRFLVAAACFALVAVARPALLGTAYPRGNALGRLALAGALGIAAYNLLLNTGEQHVSAGAASFLINCMPLFAALLGVLFLGDRLRSVGWFGVALSFGGVAMIAVYTPGGLHAGAGSLLVLGAALCAAAMGFLQKPLLRSFSPVMVTACMMWAGALLLLPWLPGALAAVRDAPLGGAAGPLATAVYLGIFPAAFSYIAWAQVLQALPLAQAASVLYLIPPVTLLFSWIWLRERASPWSLLGGALALCGVFLLSRFGRVPAPYAAAMEQKAPAENGVMPSDAP